MASKSLKNNEEALLSALGKDFHVIDYIPESLKSNIDFMIQALTVEREAEHVIFASKISR